MLERSDEDAQFRGRRAQRGADCSNSTALEQGVRLEKVEHDSCGLQIPILEHMRTNQDQRASLVAVTEDLDSSDGFGNGKLRAKECGTDNRHPRRNRQQPLVGETIQYFRLYRLSSV